MLTHITKTAEHINADNQGYQILQNLKIFCQKNNFKYVERAIELPDLDAVEEQKLLGIYIKDLIPDQAHWNNINQQLKKYNKQLLMCTDSMIDFTPLSNICFLAHPALIGVKHFFIDPKSYQNYPDNHQPKKLYNCFIHRTESTRQSWFYFLYNQRLLDRGYVSYLLYQHCPIELFGKDLGYLSDQEFFNCIHTKFGLGKLESFESAYKALKNLVPYQNFEENLILQDKILDSKYSLVLDTFAVEDDKNSWFFSEKISRALLLPTIDLCFVQKGTLSKIQSLGIVTNSIDILIDELPWPQRQLKLLEVLSQDTIEYNFQKLKQISQHNYDIFKKMYSTIDKFYTEVYDIMNSISMVDQ